MTLMTRAYLLDKYGMRLSMEELAEVMDLKPGTVYNMLAKGELKIRTYKEGIRRYAPYDAVADYFDGKADSAAVTDN